MKNRIGILGSGGAAGNIIVKELNKNGFELKCGHRNIKDMSQVDAIKFMPVDALNEKELSLFCEDCDLIVNATGPSYITSSNIARIVSEIGVKYVDVFGVILLDDEKTANMGSVIGTGNFPGLSGIILKWINEKYSKKLKCAHIYAGGYEKVTANACFDVLMSSLKGYIETNCFISFGKKKKISKTKNLSNNNKTEFLFSPDAVTTKYISEELLQVSKNFPNNEIYWNNVYMIQSTIRY
ncbi:saccharopine dehydrogenase NADP-binding domain-containing protein [Streptococcus agalactiae]|uniref:saccharopine dehydrogenase NADP-binding domain-containing protein n=1 Tax=Streptococcus agalactiae TaxID=1311 RepID=UPI000ADD958E|nr:saccharopine dehydrogenase NADP-binding domain-containing protein [Streptococcus agalactiae]